MPLMKHEDGRRIAASSSRVDALMKEGFVIEKPEVPKPDAKKTTTKKSTKKS